MSGGQGYGYGQGYNRPRVGGQGYGYGQSYTGTVTSLRSANSCDVRINGNTFNVYTDTRLPRGLSVGDQVRINGVQQYNNDIRQATVSILRNR
jgi:membrane protein implicated in regulation of membrane protease activity